MIITITGDPGSGKSTVAKLLSKKLGYKHYYIGEIRRKMAHDKGMSLAEFNKLGETEDFTDKEVDEYQERLGKTEDNFIIEGRTSFHFIPHSLKIYLKVDIKTGAKRIWQAYQRGNRKGEAPYNNLKDVEKSIKERMASDDRRYKKYYNLDAFNLNNFDYILDTSSKTIDGAYKDLYLYIKTNKG